MNNSLYEKQNYLNYQWIINHMRGRILRVFGWSGKARVKLTSSLNIDRHYVMLNPVRTKDLYKDFLAMVLRKKYSLFVSDRIA